MEPPVSVPSAKGTTPAATAAAEPLLEPPVVRSGETRVFDVAVVRVFPGDAVGEFVEVRFAGEDPSGGVHGANEGGIRRRIGANLGEKRRAGERGKTGDVEKILGEVRHAGERGTGGGGGEVRDEFGFRGELREDGALLGGR
jgi:hypothetical protein